MAVITPSQARDAGRELGKKLMEADAQNSAEFKAMMEEINKTPLGLDDTAEIGALLALPDNQFSIIAPAFIEELQKSYNDVNQQMLLVQAMNAAGRHVEDIEQEYLSLCTAIDGIANPELTAPKRDFLKELIGIVYNSITRADGIAKWTINIPIEYCHPDAKMPAYAHISDSGMDVYALEEITVNPGETKLVPLGIKVAIPLGYELQVRPKSGRCLKTKLRVANTPGTIDAGYRDELAVIIENVDPPIRGIKVPNTWQESDPIMFGHIEFGAPYTIGKGEKFAQLVLCEVPKVVWVEVNSVSDEGDRGGGFGSTGLK